MKKVQSALVEHPLPDQLHKAIAELAKAHGLNVEAFNAVTTDSQGIALFVNLTPVTQKKPTALPSGSGLISEDDPSPVLSSHAQRIADYLNGYNLTPIKLVADGAKAGLLVLQSMGTNPFMVKVTAISDGTNSVTGDLVYGPGLADSRPVLRLEDVATAWLPASVRGQRCAPGDTVWFKKPVVFFDKGEPTLTQGVAMHSRPGSRKVKVGNEEFTVSGDDVWTQVLPVEEAKVPPKPKAPSKREMMKGRKPGQK